MKFVISKEDLYNGIKIVERLVVWGIFPLFEVLILVADRLELFSNVKIN